MLTACSKVILDKLTVPEAIKNIPTLLQTSKCRYRYYKNRPPIRILSHTNLVYALSLYDPTIISPSTFRFPNSPFPSDFPNKASVPVTGLVVTQRVGRGIAVLFHDRGVSVQQHAPAVLYPRERPGTHFTGGWVSPAVNRYTD